MGVVKLYIYIFFLGGGLTNERPGTDHVISGPTRGLEKTASDGADRQNHRQTDKNCDSMTESAKWADAVKI